MAKDRFNRPLKEGDGVRLTEGMAVDGWRVGVIKKIDGGDIYVNMLAIDCEGVHRYGCEMELLPNF